jgi:hypothetical protein
MVVVVFVLSFVLSVDIWRLEIGIGGFEVTYSSLGLSETNPDVVQTLGTSSDETFSMSCCYVVRAGRVLAWLRS